MTQSGDRFLKRALHASILAVLWCVFLLPGISLAAVLDGEGLGMCGAALARVGQARFTISDSHTIRLWSTPLNEHAHCIVISMPARLGGMADYVINDLTFLQHDGLNSQDDCWKLVVP